MASRYILLPKKGPQAALWCDPLSKGVFAAHKEMPKEHISKGAVGKKRGGGRLATITIPEQLKEQWGQGWDSHLCLHTTSHEEILFPTDSSITARAKDQKPALKQLSIKVCFNEMRFGWNFSSWNYSRFFFFFCLDSVLLSHPHFTKSKVVANFFYLSEILPSWIRKRRKWGVCCKTLPGIPPANDPLLLSP